jgi:hypothetical protein
VTQALSPWLTDTAAREAKSQEEVSRGVSEEPRTAEEKGAWMTGEQRSPEGEPRTAEGTPTAGEQRTPTAEGARMAGRTPTAEGRQMAGEQRTAERTPTAGEKETPTVEEQRRKVTLGVSRKPTQEIHREPTCHRY